MRRGISVSAVVSFSVRNKCINLIVTRLVYANSLLASLNGRNTIRGQTEDIDHMLLSIPNAVLSPSSNSGSNGQRPDISIRIETSTHKDVEADDSKQDDDSFVSPLSSFTRMFEEFRISGQHTG